MHDIQRSLAILSPFCARLFTGFRSQSFATGRLTGHPANISARGIDGLALRLGARFRHQPPRAKGARPLRASGD